jgi:ketosteroid isomerase-like protein
MPPRIARLGLLALLSTTALSAAPGQRVRSDQDVLVQLENDWDTAYHNRDVVFIERLLADEFIATYGDGTRGDKAEELSRAAKFDQQIESSTLDQFTIKIYGDAAVVWMTQHLVGPSKGQRLELTFKYLDVFVLRDGRWQCVASQSTRLPAPPPS